MKKLQEMLIYVSGQYWLLIKMCLGKILWVFSVAVKKGSSSRDNGKISITDLSIETSLVCLAALAFLEKSWLTESWTTWKSTIYFLLKRNLKERHLKHTVKSTASSRLNATQSELMYQIQDILNKGWPSASLPLLWRLWVWIKPAPSEPWWSAPSPAAASPSPAAAAGCAPAGRTRTTASCSARSAAGRRRERVCFPAGRLLADRYIFCSDF